VRRLIRQHLRKAVIVTLKTGASFRGVLFDADTECVTIRQAQALDVRENAPVPVDGEVLILRPDIEYMQFV
jgi:hypothetical protein